MTTEQLERDLKALAEPRETDEHLRLATRAQLAEQARVRPRRGLRVRAAFGAGTVAAAAVAVAIVALIGAGGSTGPSSADAAIIRQALQAITTPANMIVHVKEVGEEDGTPVMAEWWQRTSPPYAERVIKGRVGEATEGAADGTTSSEYDAVTNTIYQHPDKSPPTLIDPISIVRAQLAAGKAHVAGTVTIEGISLYALELPRGVAYFDTHDYRPVYIDNAQRDGTVVRARVVAYEELPVTAENERLLSLTEQHPGARVDTDPNHGPSKSDRPSSPTK